MINKILPPGVFLESIFFKRRQKKKKKKRDNCINRQEQTDIRNSLNNDGRPLWEKSKKRVIHMAAQNAASPAALTTESQGNCPPRRCRPTVYSFTFLPLFPLSFPNATATYIFAILLLSVIHHWVVLC